LLRLVVFVMVFKDGLIKMNPREKKAIAKQKKADGGGQSIRCSKHKTKLEIVSMGKTHAQLACRKCNPEVFK